MSENVRENRCWIVVRKTRAFGGNIGRFEKFKLPKEYNNTKKNAIWYYLNKLDFIDTMSEGRMLNADDISPKELLELIPEIDTEKQEFTNAVLETAMRNA